MLEPAHDPVRLLKPIALAVGAALALVVCAAVVERVAGYDKILPGVEVRGADVSGQTAAAARDELAPIAAELKTRPVVARHDHRQFVLDPTDIQYAIDVDQTVADARAEGRSRNPIEQLGGTVLRWFRPDEVPVSARWDQDRLDEILDYWSAALADGLQNGGLRFEGVTVVEIEPRAGVGLRREGAERALDEQLRSAQRDEIRLSVGETEPQVDEEEVERAARRARAILAEPVVLDVERTELSVAPEQLAPTMRARARGDRLLLEIDTAALRAVLASQLAPLEVAPVDATFAVDGTAVSVVPAVVGRQVDLDEVAERILGGDHEIVTTLHDIEPSRTTAWARSLNITELVSTFTTSYSPGQERVKNIQRAAELVNDTVVEPGATFSLNEAIGPRTEERGFVRAPAFSTEDGFFEDYGGGVSQLSTTLFNATFFGGYEDVEHTPHSIFISRYPMGREATLNYGSIDNIFRNDSRAGVLIRAYAGASSVTVSYYGSTEGRVVEAEGPNVLEEIPVAEELVETPFLLTGETEPVPGETGYPGYTVENFRIIKRPGEPEQRERFVWTYDMRPKKTFVGTAPPPPLPPPPDAPTAPPAPPADEPVPPAAPAGRLLQ